jgi:hypothetical protein
MQLWLAPLAPDLLIVDDFGLHRLSAQQSSDLYELIIERHRVGIHVVLHQGMRQGMRYVQSWLILGLVNLFAAWQACCSPVNCARSGWWIPGSEMSLL